MGPIISFPSIIALSFSLSLSSDSESDSGPGRSDLMIFFSTDVTPSPGLIQSSTGLISYSTK